MEKEKEESQALRPGVLPGRAHSPAPTLFYKILTLEITRQRRSQEEEMIHPCTPTRRPLSSLFSTFNQRRDLKQDTDKHNSTRSE